MMFGLSLQSLIPPEVSAGYHFNRFTGSLQYDYFFNKLCIVKCFIYHSFDRYILFASKITVRGEYHLGLTIVNSIRQSRRRKTSKNDRVNGPNPSTSQHSNSSFWYHGHVNDNTIPFFDPL